MPGSGKKRGRKMAPKKMAKNKNSDVTINDFANASSGLHGRLTKALTFRTDVADCEGPHHTKDEILNVEEVSKVKDTKPRRKSKSKDLSEEDQGTDYPLDLWFLISEYIEPEAVGKFASICKSSYHVVRTAKFWFHIYKRYYRHDAILPARLRPDCMVRVEGLRACVIRALHLMYFSSGEKVGSRLISQQDEPHSLVNRKCCLMWHKKGKTRWYFYFKLKEVKKNRYTASRGESNWDDEKSDSSNVSENVSANTEDGCRILRVSCLKYGMVPLVMGLTLQTVKVTLSPGFDHHRIQLNFGTSYIPKTPTQVILLTSVVDLKVLDWWHPCYPHQDVVSSTILEETTESWDFVPSDYLTV
ncbi:transmembrane protein 183 [Venturia canescens]|uniref:transmembrane protein 183 n=1 Tax=Venturia canescens TaxID=32260 RepID=UPI001C9D0498|nr:transmembrane protein 183 [Venturia canescens]